MARQETNFTDQPKRLSLPWALAGLRNLFWVSVITVLIWVYADLEVSESRQFKATLQLSAAGAGQMVLLSAPEESVQFTAKGSRRLLARFEQWLRENDGVIAFDLADYEPGEYKEPTDKLLNRARDIQQWGLIVQSPATPPVTVIQLDRLDGRELPVELEAVGGVIQQATIDPPTVTVTAARSVWAQLDQDQPDLVIRTERQDLTQIVAGQPTPLTARLVPVIDGERVTVDPASVTVTVTVSQQTDTRTVQVDVGVLEPTAWAVDDTWQQYVLTRKDPLAWRVEITVTGAKKDLDQLRPEDIQAYVALTDDDKRPVESWLDRTVQVRFAEGKQLRLVGQAPTVQFKLEKRTDPPPS